MIHPLTEVYIKEFDITEKQATYLYYICRFGFSTSRILQLINIQEGVKDIQGVYIRLKQLEKKRLIRYVNVSSLAGVKNLVVITEKVKSATREHTKFIPAPSPKSAPTLRHNAMAIASLLMLQGISPFIDKFLTANQIMSMKKKGNWNSKIPDVMCFDSEQKTGYAIEVELNIKKREDYMKIFKEIVAENVDAMSGGWAQILYLVDDETKKKALENRLEQVKQNGSGEARENIGIVHIMMIQELQKLFNEKYETNIDMKMFLPTL